MRLEHRASAERVKHRRVAQYAAPHPLTAFAAAFVRAAIITYSLSLSLSQSRCFQYVLRGKRVGGGEWKVDEAGRIPKLSVY